MSDKVISDMSEEAVDEVLKELFGEESPEDRWYNFLHGGS